MSIHNWFGLQAVCTRKWVCGYCGLAVGGNQGFYRNDGLTIQGHQTLAGQQVYPQHMPLSMPCVMICPQCAKPTYLEGSSQVPGVAYGKPVQHLPKELDEVYTQTRNCMAVNAYVPAVLSARTILMHIAAEQGAAEGQSFTFYVDFLVNGNYVPPKAKAWVDHVRKKGNDATHKIALMTRDDAEKVLRFIEMILLFLYEYPNMA